MIRRAKQNDEELAHDKMVGGCSGSGGCWLVCSALGLDILDSGFDGILSEHAAVELDGGETEVLGNVRVFNGEHVVQRAALDPVEASGMCVHTMVLYRPAHTTLWPRCCWQWPSHTQRS